MKLTIHQEHEKLKYTTRNCKISQNLTQFLTKFNGCTLRIATFWPLLFPPPTHPKKKYYKGSNYLTIFCYVTLFNLCLMLKMCKGKK